MMRRQVGHFIGNKEAELVWLKAQVITGPAPYSFDASTPFGYSVVGLRDKADLEKVRPYVQKHMDATDIEKEK